MIGGLRYSETVEFKNLQIPGGLAQTLPRDVEQRIAGLSDVETLAHSFFVGIVFHIRMVICVVIVCCVADAVQLVRGAKFGVAFDQLIDVGDDQRGVWLKLIRRCDAIEIVLVQRAKKSSVAVVV